MSKSYLTEAYLKGDERQKFIQDFKDLLKEAEPDKDYVDKEVSRWGPRCMALQADGSRRRASTAGGSTLIW